MFSELQLSQLFSGPTWHNYNQMANVQKKSQMGKLRSRHSYTASRGIIFMDLWI